MPFEVSLKQISLLSRGVGHFGPDDLDLFQRFVLCVRPHQAHPLHNSHSAFDAAKDCMLPIQPGRRRERNEELAPVRVGTTIGHAEHACASVFQGGFDFVFELFTIDGITAAACASRVASLDHEIRDDAMEDDVVIVAPLSESREIFASFGRMVVVELQYD